MVLGTAFSEGSFCLGLDSATHCNIIDGAKPESNVPKKITPCCQQHGHGAKLKDWIYPCNLLRRHPSPSQGGKKNKLSALLRI